MKKELNIVISSNNPHKIEEFKEIFVDYPNVKILSLKDLNINVNPEENGETFKDNSFIKANAIAKLTNYPVIADDSGLEIDSLDGFPGIHSARFMQGHSYEEKFISIFEMLNDKSNRNAQFHCVITLLNLEKEPLFFEGICRGHIANFPSGKEGFGYEEDAYAKHAANYQKYKVIVDIPEYDAELCGLTVHFLPCNQIKVTTVCEGYGTPNYPIKEPREMKEPATCPAK